MDSVSRLGGDEFVVLLPALESPQDAISVAERIAAAIEAPDPARPRRRRRSPPASASRSADPTALRDATTADGLLQQADTAMYHAKSLGGSTHRAVRRGSTPDGLEADRETWVGSDPRGARRGSLRAPRPADRRPRDRRRASSTSCCCACATDDGELIPPLAFLPTAERCGLIGEIDQWVIRQAVEHRRRRPAGGGQPLGGVRRGSRGARADRARAAPPRHRPGQPRVRDHRDRGHAEHRPRPSCSPSAWSSSAAASRSTTSAPGSPASPTSSASPCST